MSQEPKLASGLSKKQMLRTATLPKDLESPKEEDTKAIDVKKLNSTNSRVFLDRVLTAHDAHDDQSILLDKVRERLETAGLSPPCVEIRFQDLQVQVNTVITKSYIPNILGPLGRIFSSKEDKPRKTRLTLLEPCSGVLKPGRLALVLGPPGSGRTTLLRSLAGRAQKQSDLAVSGAVTYNGRTFSEFQPAHAAAYVSQADLHYGELTVRETFEHAAKCCGAEPARQLLEILHEKEQALGITPDPAVDAYMKASAWTGSNTVDVERTIRLLGLEKCADTVVGNAMLRGVSGGEKKRVTTGEVLVGPARVLMGDEISTGLDSRITFDLTKYIRGWVKALNGTACLALLQPSPETFELFDDVILLNAGVVVYNGPREGVLPFFTSLGFECPSHQGVAEFLQEVVTPTDQQKYWAFPGGREYRYITAAEMKEAFTKTAASKAAVEELTKPYEPPMGDDRLATIPLPSHKYGSSYLTMWKANAIRAGKLQSRNKLFIGVRWFQVVLMSIVTGTLFLNVRGKEFVDDGNLIMGALFFSMIYMLMAGASELHLLAERLPVMFRQRGNNMYPGSAFALPAFLWRLPYVCVDAVLWSCLMYFAVGLDENAARFFMFIFLMFLTAVWSTSLHQAIGALIDATIANAVSMLVLMLIISSGGYIVIKSAIPGAWKAAVVCNPWFYINQAFAINEFTGASWSTPYNASDPTSITTGVAVLQFRDFETSYDWVWYGVAIAIASIAINVLVFVLASTFRPAPKRAGFITETAMAELTHNRESGNPVPASMKQDIEMGMKRSASMKKLDAAKGSSNSLVSMANGHKELSDGSSGNTSPDSTVVKGQLSSTSSFEQHQLAATASNTSLIFEPLNLTFQDVGYSVPVPQHTSSSDPRIAADGPHEGQLQLLHNISGSFRPGVLTALMGASGAGKTTLMDVLAGRKTGGLITGDIRVNGHPKEPQSFSRVSAYVEQEDSHSAETTVLEALEFSAALRLPTDVSKQQRSQFVQEVMAMVELKRLANNLVGKPNAGGNGLTIEQRKRLTIAVELVSNPTIVFCDEPTTGLDARGAAVVMAAIRATAATGRTVVCTIHQPSSSIFEAFDELIVLKPGGRCIYNGPLGPETSTLISYFSAIPGVAPMRPQFNPANWMLEETAPIKETKLGVDFAKIYSESALCKQSLATVEAAAQPKAGSKPLDFSNMKTPSVAIQYMMIQSRLFRTYWRMPKYILVRYAVSILVAVVFGTIFYGQGQKYLTDPSPATVLNIAGVVFLSCLFCGAVNAMTIQPVVHAQREVFYRERASGMYGELAFAIAQGIVELPYMLVQSAIYVFPVYFMIDFPVEKLGYFFLFFLLTVYYFSEFGSACVNLTPELGLATLLISFIFSFYNLFAGFMIPVASMGWWWRWFTYLNPVTWSLYALLSSQLGDVDAEIDNFGNGTITVAQFMEERFGYSYSMVNPIIGILLAFVMFFRLVSVFALTNINYQKR